MHCSAIAPISPSLLSVEFPSLFSSPTMRNSDVWALEDGCEIRGDVNGSGVVLGVDGGATSTVCVCMPLLALLSAHKLPDSGFA
ncbi:hypothetical protein QYF36_022750 [Acer negundo]|nr:hypothetical protein QYF36_022750 [Acer negundo]